MITIEGSQNIEAKLVVLKIYCYAYTKMLGDK